MTFKRNGDINFHPFKGKVEGEIIKHNGDFIVGYGEATGHHHRIQVKNPDNLIIRKDTLGNYFFDLLEDGVLSHEEHKTTLKPLKKGLYRKTHEREVDHFAGSVTRRIVD